ncbi:hypothetical protein V7652_17525 [Bacillus thuringiensis]|uniref:hypothetical protein n=2 Tax=Bacillus TaxID=1386 RepID=UPI00027BFF1B|nr:MULTISPECIES: hypothetical protein [Bacillus cereus group]EJV74890.1 hypothetical protein IGE_05428 [Bacillus cereus HuB1-1]PEW82692.1 hypothetical protein CN447_27355 [Bacillus thuringiensis]PGS64632.1 hypothetical protein COD07_27380 [Bacillus thuringiensis]HDX9688654.1 hypothetical protein [Bacillus thuringiensis]
MNKQKGRKEPPAGSASTSRDITADGIKNSMDVYWIGTKGLLEGASWGIENPRSTYQMLKEGGLSLNGSIAADQALGFVYYLR